MRILDITSQVTGVSVADIMSRSRQSEIVRARFIAFYALRTKDEISLSEIGRLFHRHHATVGHGITAIVNDSNHLPPVKRLLDGVMEIYNEGAA